MKELYCSIRDSTSNSYNSYEDVVKCLFCLDNYHHIFDCPLLALNFNRRKIIKEEGIRNFKGREFGFHRKNVKYSTFKKVKQTYAAIDQLYDKMLEELKNHDNLERIKEFSESEDLSSYEDTEKENDDVAELPGSNDRNLLKPTKEIESPETLKSNRSQSFIQMQEEDPIANSNFEHIRMKPPSCILLELNQRTSIDEKFILTYSRRNSLIKKVETIHARRASIQRPSVVFDRVAATPSTRITEIPAGFQRSKARNNTLRHDSTLTVLQRPVINLAPVKHERKSFSNALTTFYNEPAKSSIEYQSPEDFSSIPILQLKNKKNSEATNITRGGKEDEGKRLTEVEYSSLDIDTIKIFKFYYPSFNIDVITSELLKIFDQKLVKRSYQRLNRMRSFRTMRRSIAEMKKSPEKRSQLNFPSPQSLEDMTRIQKFFKQQDSFDTHRSRDLDTGKGKEKITKRSSLAKMITPGGNNIESENSN